MLSQLLPLTVPRSFLSFDLGGYLDANTLVHSGRARSRACPPAFPDDCGFFGTRNRIARWIGNAVPVSFAKALGSAALQAVL